MNETVVTVVGNVASELTLRATSAGTRVASFRVASTERRYDNALGTWRDAHTTFYRVNCWRSAAENVADSLEKGQPVVVTGKLRDKPWEDKDGVRRSSLEIDAATVGHDLTRGVARFTKATVTRSDEHDEHDPADTSLPDDHPARLASLHEDTTTAA